MMARVVSGGAATAAPASTVDAMVLTVVAAAAEAIDA
jgi:hypothetical protein